MRILIADDEGTSRAVLRAVLERAGHEVIAFENGPDALAGLLDWGGPQLAILDWMMPGMDGIDVLREVRRTNAELQLYIIMLTSRQGKSDIVEALRAGANDYIAKPFDRDELLARVNVGCRMMELQAELSAKIVELENAIDQIKTLQGIIPICAWCKKIRDDAGYWQQVDAYISEHSRAEFTHGICPDCAEKFTRE